MYICEMIRQSDEIFCSTIRNRAIAAHAFSHVNSSRSRQKVKQFQRILTFYAKVKKGHNTGQKGHNTGQKGLLRAKRDKTRPIRTKGQKGHRFSSVFFPGCAWSLAWSTRAWLNRKVMFGFYFIFYLFYFLFFSFFIFIFIFFFRSCLARQEIKQFFKSTNFNINVFPKMTDIGKFVNSFYFERLYIFLKT